MSILSNDIDVGLELSFPQVLILMDGQGPECMNPDKACKMFRGVQHVYGAFDQRNIILNRVINQVQGHYIGEFIDIRTWADIINKIMYVRKGFTLRFYRNQRFGRPSMHVSVFRPGRRKKNHNYLCMSFKVVADANHEDIAQLIFDKLCPNSDCSIEFKFESDGNIIAK